MKRILSLFLSLVLVLSMVLGTFTVNVYAEVTGGSFTKADGTVVKSFTEDFNTWRADYWNTRTANQNAVTDAQSEQVFKVTSRTTLTKDDGTTSNSSKMLLTSVESKQDNTDDKYIKLTDFAEDNSYHGRFYLSTGAVSPAADETMHLSVELMVEDSNYRKFFGVSDHLNTDMMSDVKRIIEFTSDGDIKMFDTGINVDYNTNQWYRFDILWDADGAECYIDNELKLSTEKSVTSYINPTYKFTGFWITHQNNNRTALYVPDKVDASLCVDNLSATIFNDSMLASSSPAITSVGDAGKVAYDATEIEFTLNSELPDLKAEHIKFTPDNSAASIEVTSDGSGSYTVKAQLAQALIPWTDYTLELDRACFGGKEWLLDANGFPKAIETLSSPFSVTAAPFALKAPEFSVSGTTLTAETIFVNNTDTPKWAYFMLVTKDASGAVTNIATSSKKDITTNANGENVTLTAPDFTEGSAELFVIDGYTNELLFETSYGYNYDESEYVEEAPVASTVASSGEMVLGSFDYTNKEMTVDLNAGSDSADTSGVLYVYKRGMSMKDNLIYADYVTAANDGSLKKTIVFPEDINDTTGEYTVAFYAENVNLSKDFAIYDDDAAFGGNIVKAGLDTVGRKYDDYSGELTNWALTKIRRDMNVTDETAFSLTFPAANAADQNSMRISITPVGGRKLTGRHIVKFKFFADKADSEGYVDFEKGYFTVNRDTKSSLTDGSYSIDGIVKANKWYDIEIVFELDAAIPKSTINVVDVETGTSVLNDSMNIVDYSDGQINGFKNIWAYLTYTANDDGYQMVYKDIQMLEDAGYEKPAIRYVANDGVADYDQNVIEFKVSQNNGLTADNIFVKDSQGNRIKAKSISVSEDMGEYIVTAVMEKNFASWQTYTLEVDAAGYESYRELIDGKYVAVTPISREFSTPMAPLDIQNPAITLDTSAVTYVTNIRNSTGSSVDATTVLTVVDSDGIMRSVTADSDTISRNDNTKSFTNTNEFALGDTAKYFVIKDFADPVPLFDKSWSINYDGEVPEATEPRATSKAGSKAIEFDKYDFNSLYDYDNNKIGVNLNTGAGDFVNGILCVYKTSSGMSASKLPLYIDYVSTAADGTLAKEIKFDTSFADTTAQYTVAFYSKDLADAVVNEFDVYNSSDIEQYKRDQICNDAKASSTFSGLMQVITGTDSNGDVVTEAWDIFCEDADVTTYNKLKNKENVYIAMSTKLSSVNSFDDLVELFEAKAEECYNKESKPSGGSSSPSSSNKNYGSSSTVISESVSNPDNSGSSDNVTVKSVFSDMNGHWANKHAEALFEMGVVSGYEDGSFRADNPITRAELTKIIVESLDVPDTSGNGFSDVAGGSWYESYVLRASAAGVVNGFEDGTFGPDYNVSRQDAALMIYRAMNLSQTLPTGYKFFADENDIADYASDAIRCLGDLGIITGVGKNTFKPLDNITRGEMAALICRAIDYIDSHLV